MTRLQFLSATTGAIAAISLLTAQEVDMKSEPIKQNEKRPYPDKKYVEDRFLTGGIFRKLRRIRASEGNAAAAARIPGAWQAYLKIRLGKNWKRTNAFDEWGFWVWHEAQFDSGKDDMEWSLMLYRALYDLAKTEKRLDWMMHVRPNVILSHAGLCQWAQCRDLSNEAEDYFSGIGFDLDPTHLPEQGLWDAGIPFVMRRDFPLIVPNARHVVYWQRWEEKNPDKPIVMDNLLIGLMLNLAREDFNMGRWDRAMERFRWVRQWCDEVKRRNSEKNAKVILKRDHDDHYRESTLMMAWIMNFLGYEEKTRMLLKQGMVRMGASKNDMIDQTRLEVMMERLSFKPENGNEALIEKMDKAIAREGKFPGIGIGDMNDARFLKADCLVGMGRMDEAEALLREVCERKARNQIGWLGAELELVDLDLTRKQFDRAEKTLRELMEVLRTKGVKMDELDLYRMYVKWAMLSGNWGEALRAQREVMRLLESFRMTPLLPLEQARLSKIMAGLGNADEAARLATLAKSGLNGRDAGFVNRVEDELRPPAQNAVVSTNGNVIVQPTKVASMALEKFPSRAVVSLVNQGTKAATGYLKVKGFPAKIVWHQETNLGSVELGDESGNPLETPSESIQIEAGAVAIFSCSCKSANVVRKNVILEWVGQGREEQRCEWTIETGDKETNGAVIDAAEYKDDPYFLIPVHHHLQSKVKELVNLRVVTSQPCRVELYDDQGTLQMVDSKGNGSLKDSADWLGLDRDRNLAADLLPDPMTGETRFLLLLDPMDWKGAEPLRVRVEWLVDGQWCLAAEDQIVSKN